MDAKKQSTNHSSYGDCFYVSVSVYQVSHSINASHGPPGKVVGHRLHLGTGHMLVPLKEGLFYLGREEHALTSIIWFHVRACSRHLFLAEGCAEHLSMVPRGSNYGFSPAEASSASRHFLQRWELVWTSATFRHSCDLGVP